MTSPNLAVVRALIDTQFPHYRDLPLRPISTCGTDHLIFRLGEDLSVRLPVRADVVSQVAKEQTWLGKLAPLPLAIPSPVARGTPDHGYPYDWSIYAWQSGTALNQTPPDDWYDAGRSLAGFLRALQAKPTENAPPSGPQNHYRGVDLKHRDDLTRRAISGVSDELPEDALLAVWTSALAAPIDQKAPVWIHGDLQGGNILVNDGLVSAVIDFGLSGVGDPACDCMAAWSVLPASARSVFRTELGCDAALWARGKGWAVSVAAIALDYYRGRNPSLSAISRQTLHAVLEAP